MLACAGLEPADRTPGLLPDLLACVARGRLRLSRVNAVALARYQARTPERLLTALRWALIAPDIGGLWRARGVRLIATDLGFAAGAGTEARGPAEALLMTIAGRRGGARELSGPGQRKLAGRIDAR